MPYFLESHERSINTQPTAPSANQQRMAQDEALGLRKYDQPQYETPYAPRSGPGGYPLGGYSPGGGGFGPFNYQPFTGNAAPQGLPPGLQGDNAFAAVARMALLGSSEAERNLRLGYGASLAKRLGGIAGAQDEYERELGYAGSTQGLSSGLAQRMALERRAAMIAGAGNAIAGADEEHYGALAELAKGTGTELAGIKRDEINLTFQAYLARKAMKAGNRAAIIGGVGQLGAAALGNPSAFGGSGERY